MKIFIRIAANAAMFAFILPIASCSVCGSNEASVRMIEALPKRRIERLAADMKTLADAHKTDMAYFDERTGIPPEFADLEPRAVKAAASTVLIHLSGCVDDKATITLSDTGDEQWLTLHPGEAKEPKVLWRSNPAMGSQAPD